MALKTAAQYNASYLARLPTATELGQLMWASQYAQMLQDDLDSPLSNDSEGRPITRVYSASNSGGPTAGGPFMSPRDEDAVAKNQALFAKMGQDPLVAARAVLTNANVGLTILEALADAEILPGGSPAMAAGGDPVTGKGKIT